MGQSSSSNFQNSPQPLFNRRKPGPSPSNAISPPAEATPIKIPSYAVAENKVFPNGAIDANLARKQLRPVSQELSKFHPDFADAFNGAAFADNVKETHNNNQNENRVNNNKENTTPTSNLLLSSTKDSNIMNGKVKVDMRRSVSSDNVSTSKPDPPYLRRDNSTDDVVDRSLQRNIPVRSLSMASSLEQPVKAIKHKRQTSLANGNPVQHNVIQEDPREHLYNEGREQSYPNYQPSASSLPVKNTFEMDYSLNLTYAQLAEYRRNKRTSGLGDGVDQKLKDLMAEIQANSSVPKSPFDMQNLGARSSTLSVSTASSDTGVSKSKKKKAPPPPTNPRKASLGQDSELPKKSLGQGFPGQRPLGRCASTLAKSSKAPAPSPLMKSQSVVSLQGDVHPTKPALNSLASLPKPNIDVGRLESRYSDRNRLSLILDKASVHKSKNPTQPQPDSRGNDDMNSGSNQALLDKPGPKTNFNECDAVAEMLNLVKDEKLRDGERSSPTEEPLMSSQIKPSTTSLTAEKDINKTSLITNSFSHEVKSSSEIRKPKIPEQNHFPSFDEARFNTRAKEPDFSTHYVEDSGPHEKHMNSDLQRDIVLAAQFRSVKAEQRRIGDEDKDVRSSCGAPETEQESTPKGKDEIPSKKLNYSHEDCLLDRKPGIELSNPVVRKDFELKPQGLSLIRLFRHEQPESTQSSESGTSNCQQTESATMRKFDNVADTSAVNLSKRGSVQSEDMSISSSSSSQRVFSPEWTPEQDLESDDDIMDESILRTHRRAASEGFKPSLLPSKIYDSQDDGVNKPKLKNKKDSSTTEQGQTKDATKLGSIQKLKKSVHKSAKQVFGSISKGGGDKSSRRKSQDVSASDHSDYVAVSADLEHTRNSNWILAKSDLPDSSFCSTDEKLERQRAPLSPTSNSYDRDNEARSSFSDFVNIDLPSRGMSPDQGHDLRLTRIDLQSQARLQDPMVKKHSATQSQIYDSLVDSGRYVAVEQRVETHQPSLDQNHDPKQYQRETVGEPEMGVKGQLYLHPLTLAEPKVPETGRPLWTYSDPYTVGQSPHRGLNGAHLYAFCSPNSLATTSNSMLGTGTGIQPTPYQIHSHVPMLAADYTHPLAFSGLFPQPTPLLPAASYPVLPIAHNTIGHNLVYPQFGMFQHSAEPRATSVAPNNPGSVLTPLDMSYLSQQMRMIGVTPPANQQQWDLLLSTFRYPHLSGSTSELVRFGTLTSSADTEKRLTRDTTLDNLEVKSKTQTEDVAVAPMILPTQLPSGRIPLFGQGESAIQRVEEKTSQKEASLAGDLTQANHLQSVLVPSADSTTTTTTTTISTIKNHTEMITTRNHIEPDISTEERSTPENTMGDQCPEKAPVIQPRAESEGAPTLKTSPGTGTNVFHAKLYGPMGFRPVTFHPGSPR